MRHDMRGRGTIALPQRGFALFVQGGSLMVLTLEFLATIVATCCGPRREPGESDEIKQ